MGAPSPTTIKLDDTNYQDWVGYIEHILKDQDLLGYVTGTKPCPQITTDEVQEEWEEWVTNDSNTLAILLQNVNLNIAAKIMKLKFKNSLDVWNHLKEQYEEKSSMAREELYSLLQQLRSLDQGDNLSVDDLYKQFKNLRLQIDEKDTSFPSCSTCQDTQAARQKRDNLFDFLLRLQPNMQAICTKVARGPSKTIDEVLPALMKNEMVTYEDGDARQWFGSPDRALDWLKRLLESGADPNILLPRLVARAQHDEAGDFIGMVRHLLSSGANPSQMDDKGQTALHIAAINGDHVLLNVLVGQGGDIDIRNGDNATPLHAALTCSKGKNWNKCVKLLLENKADYNLVDNDGNNAFQIAAQGALHPKLYRLMQNLIVEMMNYQLAHPILNEKNYRGYTLADLLSRLPQMWILPALKDGLASKGVDINRGETAMGMEMETCYFRSDSDNEELERIVHNNKLEDADLAGTQEHSQDCTLILTEGDSAKQFALMGVEFLGRQKYGTYCLRGKLPSTKSTMLQNEQVRGILIALGLKFMYRTDSNQTDSKENKPIGVFLDIKNLRYGHLMMIMDPDPDGIHMKALVINILHTLCPELLIRPMFLQDFVTDLYKVTNTMETKTFKFLHDFDSWINERVASEWDIRYFKGLATSDPDAVYEYFGKIEHHRRFFFWSGKIDDNYIKRAFSNGTSNDRKTWINEYEEGLYDTTVFNHTRSYSDFIKKEFVLYMIECNKRQFASLMDGQKPSSRKVLFALMEKSNPRRRMLISDLANSVSEVAVYHHAMGSLEQTIFAMGQDFVGRNSLKLLNTGLCGNRFDGGKNVAVRYLEVELASIADFVFPKEDFKFITYAREDGKLVQPQWYAPVIPLVLVNGCRGVGVGHNTTICNYRIEDIITNLRMLLDNEENNEGGKLPLTLNQMLPYYPGYKGDIEKANDGAYTVSGKWHFDDDDEKTLIIEEIPFITSYEDYEKFLLSLKIDGTIKDFRREGSQTSYCWYKVSLTNSLHKEAIDGKFRLKSALRLNIKLYNAKGILQYYSSPEKVLEEFFAERRKIYKKRKESQGGGRNEINLWRNDLNRLEKKIMEEATKKQEQDAMRKKWQEEARRNSHQEEEEED